MDVQTSINARGGDSTLDLDFINQAMTFIPSDRCTVSCGTVCVDPQTSKVLLIFNRRLSIWQLPKGRKNIGEDLHSAALRETFEETGVRGTLLPLMIRTRSTNPSSTGHDIESNSSLGCSTDNGAARPGAAHNGHHCSYRLAGRPTAAPATVSSTTIPAASNCITEARTLCAAQDDPAEERRTAPETSEALSRSNHHVNGNSSSSNLIAYSAVTTAADPKVTCDLFNTELIGIVQYPDLQVVTPNTMKTVFYYAAVADSTAPMGPGAQEDHEDLKAEWVDFQQADQLLRFRSEREAVWKVKGDMKRSGRGG